MSIGPWNIKLEMDGIMLELNWEEDFGIIEIEAKRRICADMHMTENLFFIMH